MHDIGKLILYENELKNANEAPESGSGATQESELMTRTHAALGAYLLSIWGLSDEIVETIAFHHTPSELPAPLFSPLTAVHAANAIDHELSGIPSGSPGIDPEYLSSLQLSEKLDDWRELAQSLVRKDTP